jgi:hypothetical protein
MEKSSEQAHFFVWLLVKGRTKLARLKYSSTEYFDSAAPGVSDLPATQRVPDH